MGFTEKVALDQNDGGRKPQYFREVGRLRWEASRQAARKRKRASIAGLSEEEAGGTGGQGP